MCELGYRDTNPWPVAIALAASCVLLAVAFIAAGYTVGFERGVVAAVDGRWTADEHPATHEWIAYRVKEADDE